VCGEGGGNIRVVVLFNSVLCARLATKEKNVCVEKSSKWPNVEGKWSNVEGSR
jgi:hypothetical protein